MFNYFLGILFVSLALMIALCGCTSTVTWHDNGVSIKEGIFTSNIEASRDVDGDERKDTVKTTSKLKLPEINLLKVPFGKGD